MVVIIYCLLHNRLGRRSHYIETRTKRTHDDVDIFNVIQKVQDTVVHLEVDEEQWKITQGSKRQAKWVWSPRTMSGCCCLKKNQNAPRPSEHPPVRGENVKTFRWDHRLQIQNLFMALFKHWVSSIISGRSPPLYCTLTLHLLLIAMQGHHKNSENKNIVDY